MLNVFVLFIRCFPGKKVEISDDERQDLMEEQGQDLGMPRMGELTKTTIHLRESMEFKVTYNASVTPPPPPAP